MFFVFVTLLMDTHVWVYSDRGAMLATPLAADWLVAKFGFARTPAPLGAHAAQQVTWLATV